MVARFQQVCKQILENNTMTKIDEIKVSYFNSVKNKQPAETKTIAEIKQIIKSDKYKAHCEEVAKLKQAHLADPDNKDKESKYKARKLALPCFTASGVFSERNVKGLKEHNGVAQIDLDGKDNPTKSLSDMRDALESDPHVFMVLRSPSGDGVKGLCRVPASADTHKDSWEAMREHYTAQGFNVDSTSDVSRAFFVSHDPDISSPRRFNSASQYAPVKKPAPAPAPAPVARTYSDELSDYDKVHLCLEHISPDCDHDQWVSVGMAIKSTGCSISVWNDWSAGGAKYKSKEMPSKWDSFKGSGVGIGTLIKMATDACGGVNPVLKAMSSQRVSVNVSEDFDDVSEADQAKADERKGALWQYMLDCAYDEHKKPPHKPGLLGLNNVDVLWRENVHTLVAQSKAGKTHAMAAMIHTMLTGDRTLGFTIGEPITGKVAYLDFEQDDEDFHNVMTRAGATKDRVLAFPLAGLSSSDAQQAAKLVLEHNDDIDAMFLDGYADLSADVNDQESAVALAAEWMALSKKHNVAILGVLHLNPGSETKSRGHLGSQLERKSKVILQIDTDSAGVRQTYTRFSRKREIPKSCAIQWKWCDFEGGFIELEETKNETRDREKLEKAQIKAKAVADASTMKVWSHGALVKDIMEVHEVAITQAKNYITYWSDNKILRKEKDGYHYDPF